MHFSTGAAAVKRMQLAAQGTILEETTGRKRTQCAKGSAGDRTLAPSLPPWNLFVPKSFGFIRGFVGARDSSPLIVKPSRL